MAEQPATPVNDATPSEPAIEPVTAAPTPQQQQPATPVKAPANVRYGPTNAPVDHDHPDLKLLHTKDDVHYVWEFENEALGTGPHVARTSLHRGTDIKAHIRMLTHSHPQIKPDWKKGFQAFPHSFAAQVECDRRKRQLYLRNPDRVGAEEMFPGEANRILEAGKPDDTIEGDEPGFG